MGIVLNEKELATAVVRATWSLTTSEASGMGMVDAETGTAIEGKMLGTSVRATVVASA